MALETFHPGQLRDNRAQGTYRRRRGLNYTGSFDKVVRPQWRGKTRSTPVGRT